MSFSHGAVKFPLLVGTGQTLLRQVDPTIFFLIDFFRWAIRHYAGEKFVSAAQNAGLTDIDDAVRATSAMDPVPYLLQSHMRFPFLAVYRTDAEFEERTMTRRQDASTIVVAYVLPPMVPSQAEQVAPITKAIASIIDRMVVSLGDPLYAPPGFSMGDSIARTEITGLSDLDVVRSDFGSWPGGKDLYFPAVVLTLSAVESSNYDLADLPPFNSAAADVGDGISYGATEMPLQLLAVSPQSGTRAGGETVTLTTLRARTGTTVTFQGQAATVLDIAADGTSVTVRAPALAPQFAGYPTNFPADVTIVGLDGQSFRLPASYIYQA